MKLKLIATLTLASVITATLAADKTPVIVNATNHFTITGMHCDGCAGGLTGTVRFIAKEAEYTPPVIYSVGSRGKLVFMAEAWPDGGEALNPGQPVDVRLR